MCMYYRQLFADIEKNIYEHLLIFTKKYLAFDLKKKKQLSFMINDFVNSDFNRTYNY